jgi:hypothetical protein
VVAGECDAGQNHTVSGVSAFTQTLTCAQQNSAYANAVAGKASTLAGESADRLFVVTACHTFADRAVARAAAGIGFAFTQIWLGALLLRVLWKFWVLQKT